MMADVWGVFGGVLRDAGHIRLVAKQLPTLPAVCPSQIAGRGIKLTHPSSYLAPHITSPFCGSALLLRHLVSSSPFLETLMETPESFQILASQDKVEQRSRRLALLCALASYGWGGVPTSQGRAAKSHRINCRQPYHPSSSSSSSSPSHPSVNF